MFFEFLRLPFQREGFPTKPSILTVNKGFSENLPVIFF